MNLRSLKTLIHFPCLIDFYKHFQLGEKEPELIHAHTITLAHDLLTGMGHGDTISPVAKCRFYSVQTLFFPSYSRTSHPSILLQSHSHSASPFSAVFFFFLFFTTLSNVLRIRLLIAFYFHALNIISCTKSKKLEAQK